MNYYTPAYDQPGLQSLTHIERQESNSGEDQEYED